MLLHAEKHANLFATDPVIPYFGRRSDNTYVGALAEVARRYRGWLRPLTEWRPDVYNPRRQFSTLCRHLLAAYDVPGFMDAAWFRGRNAEAQRQQGWFLHVAGGQNIRTADLPVEFSKRMAHHFLQAPPQYSLEEAFRWGQIMGQGGTPELVEAVLVTQMGDRFADESFWSTAIHWLATNRLDRVPPRTGARDAAALGQTGAYRPPRAGPRRLDQALTPRGPDHGWHR